MRPGTRDEFRIAILCALPREAMAVRAIFDETSDEHGSSYGKSMGDANSYTNGRIGAHCVVLVHMPGMGNTSSASAAANLKASYSGIELVLLVGICGGVPFTASNDEVILGDVIISNSIVEYDFGRRYPDAFERKRDAKEAHGRPNLEIRSLLAKLETEKHLQLKVRLNQHLDDAGMELGSRAQYPGITEDRLFPASYRHKHHRPDPTTPCICAQSTSSRDPVCRTVSDETCSTLGCNAFPVFRARLTHDDPKPAVHIGSIASGNTVMKSGIDRDEIAKRDDIVAFEMEGAGVWDILPCVIIKGVCDYADSHKNKRWQDYAAATAAACAKALLEYWISPNQAASSARRWVVPFQRNISFTGREAQLEQLERTLFVEGRFSKMAVHALGGMGKSSLALELAYRIRDKYPDHAVLWVTAINAQTVEQSYRTIGRKLGLPTIEDSSVDVLTLVKGYLSDQVAGRWFMILDSADDMVAWFDNQGPRLVDYVPASDTGCVLVTTRTRQFAVSFSPQDMIEIHEMDVETSTQLLTKRLIEKPLVSPDLCDDSETTQLLLKKLCYLPLAIVQAAAYMNMNQTGISDYLAFLTDRETVVETLSENFEDYGRNGYPNPVIATWLVSFDQIVERDPRAAEYLSFMSCLDPTAIPAILLPPYDIPLALHKKRHREVISCLSSYSFIHERADHAFDIHQLVHLATRNWLSARGSLENILEKVIFLLWAVFPSCTHEYRQTWRPLLSHVRHVLQLKKRWSKKVNELAASYVISAGLDGKYGEAEFVLNLMIRESTQGLGFWHLDTLILRSVLGETYYHQGLYQKAEELQLQILDAEKRLLGAEHPQTLECMVDLSSTYESQFRYQEAEELLTQVRDVRMRVLGDQHEDTLCSMSMLASIYGYQGRCDEADALYAQVLESGEQVLGSQHRFTLMSMSNLAQLHMEQGRWEEAGMLLQHVLSSRKTKLGPEHPDTLLSMGKLARYFFDQGLFLEAEMLYLQLLATQERVLGADHPRTVETAQMLGFVWLEQGDWDGAEGLHVRVLNTQKKVLGSENRDTLQSMLILSLVWQIMGRDSDATELMESFYLLAVKAFGPEDHLIRNGIQRLQECFPSLAAHLSIPLLEHQAVETGGENED